MVTYTFLIEENSSLFDEIKKYAKIIKEWLSHSFFGFTLYI
jgi:hypothetical protein